MPQTEEHLSVLDGLGLHHGVIALTRTDLVDAELAELAAAEVADRIAGTTLAGWPIVPVSATTGTGLDSLKEALNGALEEAGAPPDIGRPRMWVDRAFLVGGAGLVVTGTLTDGALSRGDSVTLWPQRESSRIRSIQSHETEVDTAIPGSRVALNLVGLEKTDVPRGTMLGPPDGFRTTRRILASLTPVREWPGAVSDRGAYQLHAGTGHWPVRIRLMGRKALDTEGAAHLQLDTPLPLRMGDRFVIREVGRRLVVAGGTVLDPAPAPGRPSLDAVARLTAALAGDRSTWAEALLEKRGLSRPADLDADTGGGAVNGAVTAGDVVMTRQYADAATETLRDLVAAYHDANPKRPGMPAATLASAAHLDRIVVDALVSRPGSELVAEEAVVRSAAFSVTWSDTDLASWEAARSELLTSGLAVPRASALGLGSELFHSLVREGRLIAVGDDLCYLPEQIDEVTRRLGELPDGFTASQFRDEMGLSRRQAIPLLEWLDANGWTSRRGDVRTVRRR